MKFHPSYTFTRRINNILKVTNGTATFTPSKDSLLYNESGTIDSLPFHASYIYHINGESLKVSFIDGREFFSAIVVNDQCNFIHYCVNDVYKGRFTWFEGGWKTVYNVKGPQKDYCIETLYTQTSGGKIQLSSHHSDTF